MLLLQVLLRYVLLNMKLHDLLWRHGLLLHVLRRHGLWPHVCVAGDACTAPAYDVVACASHLRNYFRLRPPSLTAK